MVRRVQLHWKARQAPTPQGSSRLRLTISGSMSANAIVRRYPTTEALFNELQIDRRVEGYESVDELAWRHGVDVSRIVKQLRKAATFRLSAPAPTPRSDAASSSN